MSDVKVLSPEDQSAADKANAASIKSQTTELLDLFRRVQILATQVMDNPLSRGVQCWNDKVKGTTAYDVAASIKGERPSTSNIIKAARTGGFSVV